MPRRKNLYLVVHSPTAQRDVFTRMARGVEELAPHIRARVVRDRNSRTRKWARIRRPCLTVSWVELQKYRPLRGPVVAGKRLGKIDDMARLKQAGVPVPRWCVLRSDENTDLSAFGDHVVVKPNHGGRGAGVIVDRGERVRSWPVEHDRGGRIAQEFIYTGPWPVSYRVSVFFGRVLFCARIEANHDRPALDSPDRIGAGAAVSVVSTQLGFSSTLEADEEVMALARQVAVAYPDIPLLGVDVIREHGTGRLFVLESNPAGYTWRFGKHDP